MPLQHLQQVSFQIIHSLNLLDPVVQLSRLLAQQSANQNSGSGHMSIVPSRSPQGGSKPVGHPNTANSTAIHYMQHFLKGGYQGVPLA